jgi:hypothetical protein
VGAGLPHLPAVLSASKSYSERLFRYQRIDRLTRDAADRALEAESELAVGFFGSRYERATPGERDYLMAMADVAVAQASTGEVEGDAVLSSDVAAALGKKPQSLSPARDSLLKKGLVYSGERGRIAFTVPHFGRYLRERG